MRASSSALLVTAVLSLACASGSRSSAGSTEASRGTGSGEPVSPVGLCMFDRGQGNVRHCLHYAFGRCEVFGDRCEESEINAQREAETKRVAKERGKT